jgi:hypothetical protein
MPRGSRPGERRGGRQRGTPNKKTLIKNAVFCAAASDPNRSPLDFMLALMRDPQGPIDVRLDMAAAAAPFVHARPRPPRRGRPHPMELRARRAKAEPPSGGEDRAVPCGEENSTLQPGVPVGDENPTLQPDLPVAEERPALQPALAGEGEKPTLQPALAGRPEKAELASGGDRVVLTAVAPDATRSSTLRSLSPLQFLMAVMTDPEGTLRQRARAAQVAARYKHKPADYERSAALVEDEFGFKIDPQVARTIREIAGECDCLADRSEPSPADIQKHKTLLKELREQIATIECSATYSWADLKNDKERLKEIQEQRRQQRKLPPDRDAEEAYLIARMEAYRATPKHQAWCRISGLEVRHAKGDMLTDAEISELASLRAQFPTVAQQFANRNWSYYVWDGLVVINRQSMEEMRRRSERGPTPEEIEKDKRKGESCFEAQERDKLSQRQIDYLDNRPKPV